jgi:GNAT superfamily N-acetyltransferase
VERLPFGVLRSTPSLPGHHDLNTVRIERPGPADVLAVVDTLQAAAPHRRVEVFDAEAGLPFAIAGWARDEILHLRFAGPPPAPPAGAVEVDRAQLAPLRIQWLREVGLGHVLDTILEGDRRLFTATPTRAFTVRDSVGRPVSMALLVGDGPVRMVEDVYTEPAHRGRGYGAVVVRAAVAAATDAELVHIPTAAQGLARTLYERLGFEPVAHTARYLRDGQSEPRITRRPPAKSVASRR